VAALAGLVGWLGFRAHASHQSSEQRQLFLQVGRQAALNLTTIDYTRVDADVQRILDSSTGAFGDDFKRRSPEFAAVMSQTRSKTEGTIAEAGVESADGKQAHVLVAVSVKTSTADEPQQEPRSWRMRISVEKVGNDAKVSDVKFVQ
jgi:Mce-associated membrane protein